MLELRQKAKQKAVHERDMLTKGERWKHKYLNSVFVKSFIIAAIKYILLIGLSFLIVYPLFVKLTNSFMSNQDLLDGTVQFVPRNANLDNYKIVIEYTNYFKALFNTAVISFLCGAIQMIVCSVIGYGLARFKFKGRAIVFGLVILTIIMPPQTYMISLYLKFRFFDMFGIIEAVTGGTINLLDSFGAMAIISLTGFGFKNGLFIFMMRQFYKGLPEEMEEAAYVDGSGVLKTYISIILPLSVSMMITIFLFAFSWQWTDTFYSTMFFSKIQVLSNALMRGFEGIMLPGFSLGLKNGMPMTTTLINTMSLLVITPLIVIYLFAQRNLIEGVERSGIVG